MPEISFALILTKNLKHKDLNVRQVESVIQVKGDLDPYQLQAIRDGVEQSFKDRRKNINDLIEKTAKLAAAKKNESERQAIVVQFNKAMQKQLKEFDKNIQKRVTEFCENDERLQAEFRRGRWTFGVTTLWSLTSIVWKGSKASTETAGAVATGGATAALAIKDLIDLGKDVLGLIDDLRTAARGVDDQEKRILKALAKIKKVKKGNPVPQSDIDAAETALAPFGPKIQSLENETRKLAMKLDKLLKVQKKSKIPDKRAEADAEKAVGELVEKVADMGKSVRQRRDLQKRSKDTLKTAMRNAQADPKSYWTWAVGIYDSINDWIDIMKTPEDLFDTTEQFIKRMQKALERSED